MIAKPTFITGREGRKLAFHKHNGNGPTVVFCGGYMSDMEGTKATYLEHTCKELGISYLRFDYSGHGASSEQFVDGTIGKWTEDALCVIEHATDGPLIIIGSSMGGWIGLLVSLKLKERVHAFIGIAAAPDFTRELMWNNYSEEIRETLKRDGVYLEPSEYSDEPYKVTYDLIREGDSHMLLNKDIELTCQVRLFHGLKDTSVPPEFSNRIAENVISDDVVICFNKIGDHSLSSAADLARLRSAIIELI
ncbi:MAG: alpha/beta hydrolase [Emcibacteraceae bacterium]|nr:alpha/beta hydrolase [Emcibacteraceae bacterium]MDG1995875.1 alpha/beta hydrolase [Emcibacteraceae bacterium]